MEDIITMYSIGDYLYCVEDISDFEFTECPACGGGGYIKLDQKYPCPKCHELGEIEVIKKPIYSVVKKRITSINIFITSNKTNISYTLDGKYSVREEQINVNNVFNKNIKAKKKMIELNEKESKKNEE